MKDTRKKLYLLCDQFPYHSGEDSFIIPELAELCRYYNITVISSARCCEMREKQLEFMSNIRVFHYTYDNIKGVAVLKYIFPYLLYRSSWREIKLILQKKKYILGRVKRSLFFFARAFRFHMWLKRSKIMPEGEGFIYYSYWYNEKVLGALMCKKGYPDMKIITRAHGYDLYEEVRPYQWQPYKFIMDRRIDRVVFISRHGYHYYLHRFAYDCQIDKKYVICRLGVNKKDYIDHSKKDIFLLVSCSNVTPLKRVGLIVDALAKVTDCRIHWIHFGSGNEMVCLAQKAEDKLCNKPNISYELKGYIKNEQIMDYYKRETPDCFITTSSSEGSPVSIQEALSFGIPVIGTDVGGVSELIDGNGILLSSSPSAGQVAEAVRHIYYMDALDYANLRERSYQIWEQDYDQKKNTVHFIKILETL